MGVARVAVMKQAGGCHVIPEVERGHEEAGPQESAGDGVDHGIIEAAAKGRVGMGDDGGVPEPWRSSRGGGSEGVRMVDAAIEGGAVVNARQGEGEGWFGEHGWPFDSPFKVPG